MFENVRLYQAYEGARNFHGANHFEIGRSLGRQGYGRHDIGLLAQRLGVHSVRARQLRAGFAAEGGYHR